MDRAMFASGARCLIMAPDFASGSSVFSKLLHLGNGVLFQALMDVTEYTWKDYHHLRTPGFLDITELGSALVSLESLSRAFPGE